MKNLYLIPTDKPSRLHYFTANKEGYYLYPNNELVVPRNPNCINQNIYITSDEEIKEGDWYYDTTDFISLVPIYQRSQDLKFYNGCKKIILTTDQSLDAVQTINDEFLEWFVKNPSCEEVKVSDYGNVLFDDKVFHMYKIIIPKEEPKQETLEEIALRLYPEEWDWKEREIFIEGAKWMQERMYNEEDMTEYAIYIVFNNLITPKQWFEQFKKK